MNRKDKFKNILAFLMVTAHDSELSVLFNQSPDYIQKKFERYIESSMPEFERGMHPKLKKVFDLYCEKWEDYLQSLGEYPTDEKDNGDKK